jgi:alcohol dehydrogenase class IV
MTLSTWSFPTRIVFGNGAVKEVGTHARALAGERGKALIVTDPGVIKAGAVDAVRAALDAVEVPHATFDGVHGNPLEKDVHDGFDAYQSSGATIVVAVGGGSPLDVAKLIRLLVTHAPPLAQYDDAIDGGNRITKPVPPMIAVPTTAGTGSEVGRSGVVTIEATHRKTVIFSPRLMAEVAVLDPQLTVGMPARTTAATGFDALTHNIESYLSLGDHPMADAIALLGVELCVKSLARATKTPNDLDARGDMMKAAMMGAVAFQKGLGACHSLAHPLSSEKGLHHGLANALCLPAVVAWNAEKIPERVARIAQIFGVDPKALPEAIAKLRAELGLPNGLRAEGVTEADLDKLADLATEDACHRCNPRPCTRADLLALYRASL